MRIRTGDTLFYERVLEALNKMDNPRALRENGFHLCDYHALWAVLGDVFTKREAYTFIESIAIWAEKHGMNVEKTTIGYKIILPANEPLATILD